MTVGVVIVSHSRALAEAALDLAMQMVRGETLPVAVAAGMPDGSLGTDATAVAAALAQVDQGDGVAVFADIGSALLSAEMGIELYGRPERNIRVLPAPFVEGILAGLVRVAGGASLGEVAGEAVGALEAKQAALTPALEAQPVEQAPPGVRTQARLVNDSGLHARPAAEVVRLAQRFDAQVQVSKGSVGPVSAVSLLELTSLGARKGEVLHFEATGPDAQSAAEALAAFVESGLGEG